MQTTTETPTGHSDPRDVTVLAPGAGEAIWFLDNLVTVKASARSGARFGLAESALPAGSETPLHRHRDDDESFYVLDGGMRLFLEDGRTLDVGPGTFVRIPHGVAHGFRGTAPLRMLVLSDPAGFLEFVRDFGVEAPRPTLPPAAPPDVPRLTAVAARHGIELLGPLP